MARFWLRKVTGYRGGPNWYGLTAFAGRYFLTIGWEGRTPHFSAGRDFWGLNRWWKKQFGHPLPRR